MNRLLELTSGAKEISETRDFAKIVAGNQMITGPWRDHTVKITLDGLNPGTTYYYRFTDGTTTSQVGRFTTAPSLGTHAPLSFGFSGDVDGRFRPYPSINNFGLPGGASGTQNLNYFVFLGDTMYETEEHYMLKLAVPGEAATAGLSLDIPLPDLCRRVAKALHKDVNKLMVCILNRPRHQQAS